MHGYLIAIANTISQCFVEQKQAIIYIHKGPPLSLSQKNKKFYFFLINTLFFNWRKIIAVQHKSKQNKKVQNSVRQALANLLLHWLY